MTQTVLITGIVLLLIIAGSIAQPFLAERKRSRKTSSQAQSAVDLEEQLMQLVNAVRDLDFDFDTGKIADQDYVTNRKLLIGRGVSFLMRLDEARYNERALDQEIEQLVATYRQNG